MLTVALVLSVFSAFSVVFGAEKEYYATYLDELNFTECVIEDNGKGINDIQKAREPLFTTRKDEERAGMGFTVMETFMDSVEVFSKINEGTTVVMRKQLSHNT